MYIPDYEEPQIIGGFASQGWLPSNKGTPENFLFNLTQNIRFNTIHSESSKYQNIEVNDNN